MIPKVIESWDRCNYDFYNPYCTKPMFLLPKSRIMCILPGIKPGRKSFECESEAWLAKSRIVRILCQLQVTHYVYYSWHKAW